DYHCYQNLPNPPSPRHSQILGCKGPCVSGKNCVAVRRGRWPGPLPRLYPGGSFSPEILLTHPYGSRSQLSCYSVVVSITTARERDQPTSWSLAGAPSPPVPGGLLAWKFY